MWKEICELFQAIIQKLGILSLPLQVIPDYFTVTTIKEPCRYKTIY